MPRRRFSPVIARSVAALLGAIAPLFVGCAPTIPILPTAVDFQDEPMLTTGIAISAWPVPSGHPGGGIDDTPSSDPYTIPSIGPLVDFRVFQRPNLRLGAGLSGISPIFSGNLAILVDTGKVLAFWGGWQVYTTRKETRVGDSSAMAYAGGVEFNWRTGIRSVVGIGTSYVMTPWNNPQSTACTELCFFSGGTNGGYASRIFTPYVRWAWRPHADLKAGVGIGASQPFFLSVGYRR